MAAWASSGSGVVVIPARSARRRCACSRRSPRRRRSRAAPSSSSRPGFDVPPRRPSADELPPAALDAARARDGVRRRRGDAAPVCPRDRGALPLLLLRRCDADPVTCGSSSRFRYVVWRRDVVSPRPVLTVQSPAEGPRDERTGTRVPSFGSDHGPAGPVFEVQATDGAARAGVLRTAHGEIRTPVFMPVGTKGTVKTLHPDEVRDARRADPARQHLPPALPPGRRADPRARRAAPLHGLGRADPHRLRRLPGLLAARHDRAGRRRRRHVPQRLRRRARRASRPSSPRRSRRTSAATSRCASTRCRRRASRARELEEAVRRTTAVGRAASATRRAPTGSSASAITQGGIDPELRRRSHRGDRRARLRRQRDRRARDRRGPRRDVRDDRLGAPRCCRPTSRATSWASATRRGSSR